jgi:hypothetical protein
MRSRFDSSRFDSSLVGLQWALRFVLIAMLLLALAACSDDPTSNSNAVVAVQVTAAAPSVELGDSVLLSAAPKLSDGTVRTDLTVSWFSTDTSVARVEGRAGQKAMVVGRKAGTASIRAMAGNKAGETAIEVVVTPPAELPVITAITPNTASEGDPLLTITVNGAHFTDLSLVKWNGVAVSTEFVSPTVLRALITPANLAQAGTADVTVRTGPPGGGTSAGKPFTILSRVATVKVELPQKVLWVGEVSQLNATPRDQNGNDLPKRATAWSTTNEIVLTVNAQGVVTPIADGYAEVRAEIDGKTGIEGVYVRTAPTYDLMYDSNRGNGGRELWIISLGADATPRRWLPEGTLAEDAATNPDGTRIAFVCRDEFFNSDICVANRDGSGMARLTTYGGADDQPAWSRDGAQIAFRSMRGVQSQIWIMNADGSNQRNMMGDSYNVFDGAQGYPSFGTNGRVYFQISYPGGESVLASMPISGTWQDVKLHTPAGYADTQPAVSWDGSTIMVNRKPTNAIAGTIMYTDLEGNTLFSLNLPGRGFMPSWSRNDQYVTYSSSEDGLNALNVYVSKRNDFWSKLITAGVAIGGGRNPIFIKR